MNNEGPFDFRGLPHCDVIMVRHKKSGWAEFYYRKELLENPGLIDKFKSKLQKGKYWESSDE